MRTPPSRGVLNQLGVIFAAWTVLGAVAVGSSLLGQTAAACDTGLPLSPVERLPELATGILPPYLYWALVTPFILLMVRRRPLERLNEPRVLGTHVGALALAVAGSSLFIAVAHNLLVHLEGWRANAEWHLSLEAIANDLRSSVPLNLLTYAGIVAVGAAFAYYRASQERRAEAAELNTRLAEARYANLRAKVEPHFLFNTLNTISALAESDPRGTRETVASLSALLRRALDHGAIAEVTLEEELSFSQHYLEIERRRHGARLHVEFAVAREVRDLLVPSFLLQPLVENSIRHGTSRRRGPSRIRVEARRADDSLAIVVRDDGPGLRGELVEGIGLRSTRARIEELYGSDAWLRAGNLHDGGFEVEVRLPAHVRPATVAETLSDAEDSPSAEPTAEGSGALAEA